MQASCSLQSELRPPLLGLAPPRGLATHCGGHCSVCVALDVIPTFLHVTRGSLLGHPNRRQGLRSLRDLTQHLTARADDSHAAPVHPSLAGTSISGRCECMSSPGKVLRVASN